MNITSILAALACSALVAIPTSTPSSVTLEASWVDSDTVAISMVDVVNFEVSSIIVQLDYEPDDAAIASWRVYDDFGMWISTIAPQENPPGEIPFLLSVDHHTQDPIDGDAAIADIHMHSFGPPILMEWSDHFYIFNEDGQQPDVINFVGP